MQENVINGTDALNIENELKTLLHPCTITKDTQGCTLYDLNSIKAHTEGLTGMQTIGLGDLYNRYNYDMKIKRSGKGLTVILQPFKI